MTDWTFLLTGFMAIFITINPFSKVPFFAMLTQGYTRTEKHHVISNAVKVSIPVMLLFAILGKYIFLAFGIGFVSMKVLGGIILFKIGWDLLRGQVPRFKGTEEEEQEALDREMVGVVPLAIPMMAGPGSIITVMIFMGQAETFFEQAFFIGTIIFTILLTYVLLLEAEVIIQKVGRIGIQSAMRMMGIVISAIGIQTLINSAIEVLSIIA